MKKQKQKTAIKLLIISNNTSATDTIVSVVFYYKLPKDLIEHKAFLLNKHVTI